MHELESLVTQDRSELDTLIIHGRSGRCACVVVVW